MIEQSEVCGSLIHCLIDVTNNNNNNNVDNNNVDNNVHNTIDSRQASSDSTVQLTTALLELLAQFSTASSVNRDKMLEADAAFVVCNRLFDDEGVKWYIKRARAQTHTHLHTSVVIFERRHKEPFIDMHWTFFTKRQITYFKDIFQLGLFVNNL